MSRVVSRILIHDPRECSYFVWESVVQSQRRYAILKPLALRLFTAKPVLAPLRDLSPLIRQSEKSATPPASGRAAAVGLAGVSARPSPSVPGPSGCRKRGCSLAAHCSTGCSVSGFVHNIHMGGLIGTALTCAQK